MYICHCFDIDCGHVDVSFAGANTLQYTTVAKHQLHATISQQMQYTNFHMIRTKQTQFQQVSHSLYLNNLIERLAHIASPA